MNKLGFTLIALFAIVKGYALPVGNPWDASLLHQGIFSKGDCRSYRWSARVGFYGDYVFNHHTQINEHNRKNSIHSTKLFTNAAFFALNLCERLDLFATCGSTEFQFETRARVLGGVGPNSIVRFETDTHVSWSIGLRGTIWQCGPLGVGAELQYFRAKPHLNFIRGEVDNPVYFSHERLKYQEWQIGLGIAYKVDIYPCTTSLVPYLAVKWDHSRTHLDHALVVALSDTYELPNLKNERCWGFAIGLTLVGCSKASVTAEGRFGDENGIYVNTQFRF